MAGYVLSILSELSFEVPPSQHRSRASGRRHTNSAGWDERPGISAGLQTEANDTRGLIAAVLDRSHGFLRGANQFTIDFMTMTFRWLYTVVRERMIPKPGRLTERRTSITSDSVRSLSSGRTG